MSVDYCLLKGKIKYWHSAEHGDITPHTEILVSTKGGRLYKIPLTVKSLKGGAGKHSWLLFCDKKVSRASLKSVEFVTFKGSELLDILSLPEGLYRLRRGIDYIRSGLIREKEMFLKRPMEDWEKNDLNHKLISKFKDIKNRDGTIYIFGDCFRGGIHQVHMNQGNRGKFSKENGTYRDGAILLEYEADGITNYEMLFFAFQSQSWHTDIKGDPVGMIF